jgi:transcriptional regulator with XRE-family HTH domain
MPVAGLNPREVRQRPLVGRQIRQWRTTRGLTLAEVAERTGMNTGYLSQVENDKASPSLESLGALSMALDVPVAWFLLEPLPPRVVRAAERPHEGDVARVALERIDGGISRDIRITLASFAGGQRTGFHAHPAGDEHRIVQTGRFRVLQAEQSIDLEPGDYLVLDAAIPHDIICLSEDGGACLVITQRETSG